MIDYDNLKLDELIDILNELQKRKLIRIIDYDNLEIKLKTQVSNLVEADINDFISQYRGLFKGKKVGAMGSSDSCAKNMAEFMKTYPNYSKEHILKATEAYIKSCANSNYTYLQQADYFIFKAQDHTKAGRMSRLLQWCEEIVENTNVKTERVEGI